MVQLSSVRVLAVQRSRELLSSSDNGGGTLNAVVTTTAVAAWSWKSSELAARSFALTVNV